MEKPPENSIRQLLSASKINDKSWQDEVGRAANLAYIEATNPATTSSDSLRLMALVIGAQYAGSKNAKKINLNVSRFRDGLPDNFVLPKDEIEQENYLEVLSKIQAEWCLNYIEQQLSENIFNKKIYEKFLSWAFKNSDSIGELQTKLLHPILNTSTDLKVIITLFREIEKTVSRFVLGSSSEAAKTITQVLDRLAIFIEKAKSEKIKAALIDHTINLVKEARSANPGLVSEPILLYSLKGISKFVPKGSCATRWGRFAESIALASASAVCTDLERYGNESLERAKLIASIAEELTRKFKSYLAKQEITLPIVAYIYRDTKLSQENSFDSGPHFITADLMTRLAGVENLKSLSDEELKEVPRILGSLSVSLGLFYIGDIGGLYSYDPIAHKVINDSSKSTDQVRILKPGIVFKRADGSERILQQALVEFVAA